jgi:ornithine decarboxylase
VDDQFPERPSFEEFAATIRAALATYFDIQFPGVQVIAEPGRFVAETFTTLLTQVQSADVDTQPKRYFINDSLYGRLNGVLNDGLVAQPQTLNQIRDNKQTSSASLEPAVIYGATCDSDMIVDSKSMPVFAPKDMMFFNNNGAYSSTTESTFNGLKRAKKLYFRSLNDE